MPGKTDAQALTLVRTLYAATDGRPQQWRSLGGLSNATDEAVQYAAARGWIIVEGGHSVCLTDEGRKLAKV